MKDRLHLIKTSVKTFIKDNTTIGPVLWRGGSGRNSVALTFDDGPHPEHSPKILDALKKEGACATFFLNGSQVLEYPDIVRRMVAEGHEIGNHTFSHRRLRGLSLSEVADEIERTKTILEEICGKVTLIRPPWGTMSFLLLLYVIATKQRLVLWTHDSGDSSSKSMQPDALVTRIEGLPLQSGDILLFHDDYEHTVRSMPQILSNLRRKGVGLSTVSGLLSR